nr:MAG: ORF1 [TTV-like mini virus]
MPYWYRRGWRFRPRRIWRRRTRRPFYTRRWRRKRYYRRWPVRKRLKLRSIVMRQFNPPKIHKLKCRAIIPLFITTPDTLSRNFSMYWYETMPHYVPGGGGFSIICFNLQAFYQLFKKVMCYWTYSNNEHPLIRYTGASIKLFQSQHTDYITTYHNCFPMRPTLDTYNSCQPSILALNNRHKIIPCLKDRKRKKPYTKIRVPPPSQMIKKWYFQNELADVNLLMLMTSAMSLDRYFANSNSQSTTIGFTSLDTNMFQYHNWKTFPTSGYSPKENIWLWALENGTTKIEDELVLNLIFLGQTKQYTKGSTIKNSYTTGTPKNKLDQYLTSEAHWGNPFYHIYLKQEVTVLTTNKSPHDLQTHYNNITAQTKIGTGIFQTPVNKFLQECRYNPYSDNGSNNIFLEGINKVGGHNWQQPTDPKLEGGNYPIWLSSFGFLDWQKNRIGPSSDLDYVCIIVSDHITPKLGFYLPLDDDFQEGRSPFQPENTLPSITDQTHWQPKVRFQTKSINTIASCGPGTIKLAKQTSAEAHAQVTFYFKLGGCGPPMSNIEDPKIQPQWPTPDNILQQPSLQSPSTPLENFLYNFDERRGTITNRAVERLLSIKPTKKDTVSFTDTNLLHQSAKETSSEDSEEETEKETLLRLIQQQHHKQHKFRQRIIQLMTQLK